jgi:hypothetical protein
MDKVVLNIETKTCKGKRCMLSLSNHQEEVCFRFMLTVEAEGTTVIDLSPLQTEALSAVFSMGLSKE